MACISYEEQNEIASYLHRAGRYKLIDRYDLLGCWQPEAVVVTCQAGPPYHCKSGVEMHD